MDMVPLVPRFTPPKASGFGDTGTNVRLASTPVPLSVGDCGLPGASSASRIVTGPRGPSAPGVNVTSTKHVLLGAVAWSTTPAMQVVVPAIAKSAALVPTNETGFAPVRVAMSVPELVAVIR